MAEETCSASILAAAAANSEGTPFWKVMILSFFAFPTIFWVVMYVIPQLFMTFRPVPDLKKRYDATWSLVTGGGSGIGKALSFKLARQGLNVVVVSLDDDFLKATMKQLKETFPDLEFRSVGCAFSPGVDYLKQINEATKDIEIPIIFNNAGFLVTGFFDQAPLGKLLANVECTYIIYVECTVLFLMIVPSSLFLVNFPSHSFCFCSTALRPNKRTKGNATAAVNISHHFVSKLVSSKKKGCVVFTSSVAGFIPTPFSGMYGTLFTVLTFFLNVFLFILIYWLLYSV
jgi:short-subunit dehydrogenase